MFQILDISLLDNHPQMIKKNLSNGEVFYFYCKAHKAYCDKLIILWSTYFRSIITEEDFPILNI